VGLSALLDAVEAGEEVVITRRGRSLAQLIRESGGEAASGDWVARLRRLHAHQPGPAVRSGAAAGAARSGAMKATAATCPPVLQPSPPRTGLLGQKWK